MQKSMYAVMCAYKKAALQLCLCRAFEDNRTGEPIPRSQKSSRQKQQMKTHEEAFKEILRPCPVLQHIVTGQGNLEYIRR